MIAVSEIKNEAPVRFATPLQQAIYGRLAQLAIPFERVDCEAAVTMDDCKAIDSALGVPTVKTLFLCNRQQTAFYLFVTPGDKPFVTRDFGKALGVSRVSFASAELLAARLGTAVGAASPLSILADTDCSIRMVVDSDVAAMPVIACPDGTTTCYMRLATEDILDKYYPSTGHTAEVISV